MNESAERRWILATGADGFIGRHVTAALAAKDWRVVGLDHRVGYGERDGGREAARVEADFASPRILDEVADGRYAAVVHHAAIVDTRIGDAELMMHENTRKALRLAAAAHRSRTPLIYASSSSVYGRFPPASRVREEAVNDPAACSGPLNAYAASKLALDRAMTMMYGEADWFWAGLRYTNVFGEGEAHKGAMASILYQIVERAASGRRVLLFSDTLEASRDYVPVAVVAERVAEIATGRGGRPGVYNVGSGVAVPFVRLVEWCEEFGGRPLEVELAPNPYASAYQYWTCVDMSKWSAEFGTATAMTEGYIRRRAEALYAALGGVSPVRRS